MAGVKQTRAALERFGEHATSLADWSAKFATVTVPAAAVWGLRFVFYWRYSDADRQDPATSRAWQLGRAQPTIAGSGVIVREVADEGVPREVPWARRPGAAALLRAAADPERDFDAIVIGSHERAFYGHQFSLVAPVLAHHGVQLWMPETGGPVDPGIATIEDLMALLGILARREVVLKRTRALGAMEHSVRELGRFMGGRPPYGYLFVDLAPHPNRRLGSRGVTLQHLAPHPETSQVVAWIFQARIDGHTYRRIARALNDTAVPCPSAADPGRNPHRSGAAWTDGAVREILLNPVYTGYSVWGRERTERILVDPDNPALGNRKQRVHTTPDQWTFSKQPTHPAIVSEHEFLSVQTTRATPASARHDYRLTGLLACGVCGRRMEGAWSHGNPAYRCRHGKTSVTAPDGSVNTFIRERDLLARFGLLHARLESTRPTGRATTTPATGRTTKTASTNTVIATTMTLDPEEVIDYLRRRALVLSYDPRTRTLEANSTPPARVTV